MASGIGTTRVTRQKAIEFFKLSLQAANQDIENCELLHLDCRSDFDTVAAINLIQAKYEALADELENSIQRLK
jgi:glycine cleavage system regulatory protein